MLEQHQNTKWLIQLKVQSMHHIINYTRYLFLFLQRCTSPNIEVSNVTAPRNIYLQPTNSCLMDNLHIGNIFNVGNVSKVFK